jgi:hypothetical protein
MRILVMALAMLLVSARLALAQFEAVTGLFKDVHSITLYGQASRVPGGNAVGADDDCLIFHGLCGAGTEVLIDLASSNSAHMELGLGASFLRRIDSSVPGLDVRASLRSFPTLGVYATFREDKQVQPYIGGNFGLVELWNAQAYDAGRYEYAVKGQTFEWGITGGLYFNIPHLEGLFAEAAYRRRLFSSLDYSFPKALETKDSVPPGWPLEMDLSGLTVSIGWQFNLKPDPPATLRHGTWLLTRVDASELPATLLTTQDARDTTRLVRRQLVGGMLSLVDSSKTYRLELQYREVTITRDGKELYVVPLPFAVEPGSYSIANGMITLDPGAKDENGEERRKYPGVAVDSVLRLPSADSLHVLQFKRAP